MRKFILCIGASKSGTTWLYHYLRRQPNVALGFRKEYNVLCEIYGSSYIGVAGPEIRVKSHLSAKVSEFQKLHKDMCKSVNSYCDYFDKLTPSGGFSMDISPKYLSLNAENINEVLSKFIERGFSTYVVLLLRDPVDRIVSHAKMVMKYKLLRRHLKVSGSDTLQDVFDKLVSHADFNIDYTRAIRNSLNLDASVTSLIYPYENLMSQEGVDHLSAILQLKRIEGFEGQFYNKGNIFYDEDIHVTEQLKYFFKNQYTFCNDFFSSQGVELKWTKY